MLTVLTPILFRVSHECPPLRFELSARQELLSSAAKSRLRRLDGGFGRVEPLRPPNPPRRVFTSAARAAAIT
jgi:hypothetical protein